MTDRRTVPERLDALGTLFKQRNEEYQQNYRRFGSIVRAITGKVILQTDEDFNRFALLVQIVAKVSRYGHSFEAGGHADSLDDASVYCQMLREVDDRTADVGMYATLGGER